ncbi:caspase family protein [Rhodopseudomonas sp. HC1]|uniref:caspase family protein n=1 Tax=Rhodopseudomonas infernalis TaxID=2897386 RepID=UPI001EE8ED24|nr:caspase family protein [Rhodopseudomonas infernalis]MCG6206043.1 caspase family protein [Rhodopseudomonas infernalis]
MDRAAGLLLGLVMMVLCSAAWAETRVALVVGNSAYRHVAALDNPTKDAELMVATLRRLGFRLVGGGAQLDVDKARFDSLVQQFGRDAAGADVGLFYYAGHGLQIRGVNYLVPVGANPTREADVDFQMLDVGLVLRQMESAGTRLNIVLLDACRNNPFGGRGLRSSGGGLAQMQAPEGTLISYSTQPGNVALDGDDGNSPYTRALAEIMTRPGLDVFQTFNRVGLAVKKATANAQQPWLSSSPIQGDFYFSGHPANAADAPTRPQVAAVQPEPAQPSSPRPAEPVTLPNASPSMTPAALPPRGFRVLDGISEGILNMRSGPGTGHPIVVAIPAGSTGVFKGRCRSPDDGGRNPWCEVEWRGRAGWVSSRSIVETSGDDAAPPQASSRARRVFRVLDSVSQGVLHVRAGPGTAHPALFSIPAGTSGVEVGRCRKSEDGGRAPWCEVEWGGRSGWASACCMVDAATGAFATVRD